LFGPDRLLKGLLASSIYIVPAILLFDSHIHLTDDEYSNYIPQILNNLRALNIRACSVTVDIETSLRSLELFNNSTRDVITQFIGIHPEFVETVDLMKFIEIFRNNIDLIDGIGEIGLDPTYLHYKGGTYDKQKEVFNILLSIAEKNKKPVSIHSRKSLPDILETLKTYNLGGVLLHWFAGSKKQLNQSMDMGLYVGYGPVLVYSDEMKMLLRNSRKDRILVETDGPVKYSKCFKGLITLSSSFLISVIKCAGDVLEMTYEETVNTIEKNSESFLKGSP
jgi:TatD DNase family protein